MTTAITDKFSTRLGPLTAVRVEYEYTPPVRADVYCGHDAPDREGEPGNVDILAVMLGDDDIWPLLDAVYAKEVLARAERVAAFRRRL